MAPALFLGRCSVLVFAWQAVNLNLIGVAAQGLAQEGSGRLRGAALVHLDFQTVSTDEVQKIMGGEIRKVIKDLNAGKVVPKEQVMVSMYDALPKNRDGFLDFNTARYALHRYFVEHHGWYVRGLEPSKAASYANVATLPKDSVLGYMQSLFEAQVGSKGLVLREVAVLAASLEQLFKSDYKTRLEDVFQALTLSTTQNISVMKLSQAVELCTASWILGKSVKGMTVQEVNSIGRNISMWFADWNETLHFIKEIQSNDAAMIAAQQHEASASEAMTVGFTDGLRIVEQISERMGGLQRKVCSRLKATLSTNATRATGRVQMKDFYYHAVKNNDLHFTESLPNLARMGVLDETDPKKPQVIVPNYVVSRANCIASTGFYSVCCPNECEALIGHLEMNLQDAWADPEEIVKLVSNLPSASVPAPRNLSERVLRRLEEVAVYHSGIVPIHGRLFAQWLHHVYPSECPYPHPAGSLNTTVTAEEWLDDSRAAAEVEMERWMANTGEETQEMEVDNESEDTELPWSPEEELLVIRPSLEPKKEPRIQNVTSILRNIVLLIALSSLAYYFVEQIQSGLAATAAAKKPKAEV